MKLDPKPITDAEEHTRLKILHDIPPPTLEEVHRQLMASVEASKHVPVRMKTVTMLYFGRKPPKGWKELSAMHLGHGFWMFRIEREIQEKEI